MSLKRQNPDQASLIGVSCVPAGQALELMLRHYQGALVVVSHDETFLEKLNLTHRLMVNEQGWQLIAWHKRHLSTS
ncbi:hypothetical protein GCM10010082_14680 [Kushneria pakistanensis]|uniref:ABC transporter ATP-binding protein n=1 Tax=Kushneria pakistanensis TaxID=1508770 RepID=A0ABQ3FH31_9GAMM|nr:hypothetical protein GCM10010082_14680 [Kushneria pakistanensis]